MSDFTPELEERIAGSVDPRERAMMAMEIAWELRRSDPLRSNGIIQEWTSDPDPLVRAIVRTLELYRRPLHEMTPAALLELDELEHALAGVPVWRGRALNLDGVTEYHMGDYSGALEKCRRALAEMRDGDDRSGIALALSSIGVIQQELGDYPAALENLQNAHRIHESLGDEAGIAGSLNNLAALYYGLGEFHLALERFQAALAINERNRNRSGTAIALNNIAGVFFELGDFPASMEYHRRSMAIAEEQGQRTDVAYSLNNIANIELSVGDHSDALEHFRTALAIHEEYGSRAGSTESLVGIGRVLLEIGEIDQAIESLRQALAGASDMEAMNLISDAHEVLVTAYERAGDHRLALEHLRAHLEVGNRIRSEETRHQIVQLETQRRISDAEKEAEIERLRNIELADALRRLKETQAQLVQSERMAGIGQLTAGIAHEINNPINYVSSSLPSLLRDVNDLLRFMQPRPGCEAEVEETVEEIHQLLHTSQEGARRVSEIVAGLRSFSRLDEDDLKPADLHEGLDASLALLGSTLDGRITVVRHYGDLPAVECFPGQINQLFMNILSNAVDAIEGTGEISITTSADDRSVSVAIADSGSGIAAANLDRIFDPFFTTKDVGRGTGLGLAICHGIIKTHGGDIAVESAPGGGSTFRISLPLSRRPPFSPSPTLPLSS